LTVILVAVYDAENAVAPLRVIGNEMLVPNTVLYRRITAAPAAQTSHRRAAELVAEMLSTTGRQTSLPPVLPADVLPINR
jgi:hypothetical protein